MIKFEVGKTYSTRSIGDHNCIISITVTARTDKTISATLNDGKRKTFRPGVNYHGTAEEIAPWGRGSMMPRIDATETKVLRPDWEREEVQS